MTRVAQHHPGALVELSAVHADARVVDIQRALVRGAHPARDRRAAGLDQRQVAGVDHRLGALGVDVAEAALCSISKCISDLTVVCTGIQHSVVTHWFQFP